MNGDETATTLDRVCSGEITVEQPAAGYRHNLDAVILARFARARWGEREAPSLIVDLGAGVGVIGLLLARAFPAARLLLVELQPELAELARRNAARNGMARRAAVRCEDLRDGGWGEASAGERALLACNPPFFRVGEGRLSPRRQLALARHELELDVSSLMTSVATAGGGLGEARLFAIQAASRHDEVVDAAQAAGLALCCTRPVLPWFGAPASRVLYEVAVGEGEGQGVVELEPLVDREHDGRLSAEVQAMLQPAT